MGSIYHSGFTIIETMLFLAITGVLVVAILAGSGAAINNQRYQDSVTNLKTTLQDEYSQVANVNNPTPPSQLSCASVTGDPSTPSEPRGEGSCVIMGRFISIVGTTITASSVVGYNSKDESFYANKTDIQELQDYTLALIPSTTTNNEIEWGSQIAWPKSGADAKSPTTPRTISILIIRSPKSGLTYTFTGDSASTNVSALIVAGNSIPGQSQRRICVDPNGLAVAGGLAVFIDAYAAGPTAIEIRTNDMGDNATC